MKRLFTIGAVVLLAHIAGVSHAMAGGITDQARVTQNLTSRPLAFTQNMGQWDERVLFRADACGTVMWFTRGGVFYQFTRRIESSDTGQDPRDPDMFGSDVRIAGDWTYEHSVGRNLPRAGGFTPTPIPSNS